MAKAHGLNLGRVPSEKRASSWDAESDLMSPNTTALGGIFDRLSRSRLTLSALRLRAPQRQLALGHKHPEPADAEHTVSAFEAVPAPLLGSTPTC